MVFSLISLITFFHGRCWEYDGDLSHGVECHMGVQLIPYFFIYHQPIEENGFPLILYILFPP